MPPRIVIDINKLRGVDLLAHRTGFTKLSLSSPVQNTQKECMPPLYFSDLVNIHYQPNQEEYLTNCFLVNGTPIVYLYKQNSVFTNALYYVPSTKTLWKIGRNLAVIAGSGAAGAGAARAVAATATSARAMAMVGISAGWSARAYRVAYWMTAVIATGYWMTAVIATGGSSRWCACGSGETSASAYRAAALATAIAIAIATTPGWCARGGGRARLVCSRVIIAAAAVGELACANGKGRKGAVGKTCRGRISKGRDLYKEGFIYKYRIYPHQVGGGW